MTEIRKGQVTMGDSVVDVIEIWQDQCLPDGNSVKTLTVCIPVEPDELISVVL